MSVEPFRRQERRGRRSVSDENRLRAEVEALARTGTPSGGAVHSLHRAGSQLIVSDAVQPHWVNIDAPAVDSHRYEAFTEQVDDGAGGWVDLPDGLLGSTAFPAFSPPGWPTADPGDVCLALPSADGASLILLTPPAPDSGSEGDPVIKYLGPFLSYHVVGPVTYEGDEITYENSLCFQEFVSWGAEWSTLTESQNHDYAWDGSPWLRLATDVEADFILDGIAEPGGTCEGSELVLTCTGPGTLDLLDHEDLANGSDAVNRFITPDGATWTLAPDDSAWLRYDRSLSRWRIIDRAPPAGTGTALEVKEVDGTPDYTGVGVLEVDSTDGVLYLTQPGGAGTARLNIRPAALSTSGYVTAVTQTFSGAKQFIDGATVVTQLAVNGELTASDGPAGYPARVVLRGSYDHATISPAASSTNPFYFGLGGTYFALVPTEAASPALLSRLYFASLGPGGTVNGPYLQMSGTAGTPMMVFQDGQLSVDDGAGAVTPGLSISLP